MIKMDKRKGKKLVDTVVVTLPSLALIHWLHRKPIALLNLVYRRRFPAEPSL